MHQPDPIKHFLAVTHTWYEQSLFSSLTAQHLRIHSEQFDRKKRLLFLLSMIPLAYATKSIVVPLSFLFAVKTYQFQTAQTADCFYCQHLARSRERNVMAEKRELVLRAIYLAGKGTESAVVRLDTLEKLDEAL